MLNFAIGFASGSALFGFVLWLACRQYELRLQMQEDEQRDHLAWVASMLRLNEGLQEQIHEWHWRQKEKALRATREREQRANG